MVSIFILELFRSLKPKKSQSQLIFLVFLLCFASSLFSAQITVVGNVTVYSDQDSHEDTEQDKDNLGGVVMFIGNGAVVTNLESIISNNSDLKVIHEVNLSTKPQVQENKKIAQSLRPKVSKKEVKIYHHVPKIAQQISSKDSSENLALFYLRSNLKSISTNYTAKVKIGILRNELQIISFSTIHAQACPISFQIKHDFQHLVFHLTRPPPSFS